MPVGALLDDGFFRRQPVLPHHTEGTPVLSGPARVRQEAVLVDQERVLGFNDLDGRIRHIAEPIGPGVLTVERRSAAAPGYIVELDVQEAFAVFVDAGDGEAELVAAGASRHTAGQ